MIAYFHGGGDGVHGEQGQSGCFLVRINNLEGKGSPPELSWSMVDPSS